MGIEPTLAAWEAAVLPLNYTRTRHKSMPAAPGLATRDADPAAPRTGSEPAAQGRERGGLLAALLAGVQAHAEVGVHAEQRDRKSTRLNSSHVKISYAVFCLKKK